MENDYLQQPVTNANNLTELPHPPGGGKGTKCRNTSPWLKLTVLGLFLTYPPKNGERPYS